MWVQKYGCLDKNVLTNCDVNLVYSQTKGNLGMGCVRVCVCLCVKGRHVENIVTTVIYQDDDIHVCQC